MLKITPRCIKFVQFVEGWETMEYLRKGIWHLTWLLLFFLENWVLRYLIIIFTGIGLHDRIMKTTEKISVEPGSYLAEYRLSITV